MKTTRKTTPSKTKTSSKPKTRSARTAKAVGSKWSMESAQLEALSRSLAVIEFELDGTIVQANGNFLKTLDYTLEEIKGRHHSMFVDPAQVHSHEYREFWAALNRGEFRSGEFRRIGKGGKEVWIQASYNPILDKDGKAIRVVKFASDVTAAKLQWADFQGQLAAISKAQAVIEFNLDGTIRTANENFLKAVGYSLEEIQGKHHSMFVDPAYASSHEYRQMWDDLRAGKFKVDECKRFAKGGREFWIQASYNPIFDQNGRPFKVVKFATDVTAAKLQNADFQGQLAAIEKSQAVIEFNLDGTIRTANANFLNTLGYSLDEVKGKHHSMFVDPKYAASADYRLFWDELRAGKFQAAQYLRFGKGGKEVWIQASYNPIFDLNGRPYKVVKYATDISAAKKMEFEIAESQKRDAQAAIELQSKVSEILTVVNKVSKRDYSQTLTVSGADAIGQLGEGLTQFFKDKREFEVLEQQRSERERRDAEELQRKVAAVLEIVNSVADGRFDTEIPDLGDDAVGQIATALQQAVNSVKDALLEVRDVAVLYPALRSS